MERQRARENGRDEGRSRRAKNESLDGNGRRRRAGEHDGRRADEVKEGPFKQALPFYSTVFRKKKNLLSLLYPMIDV